jgi:GNAT superfamily N-acetyltransferase
MGEIEVAVSDNPGPEIRQHVIGGLVAFNDRQAGSAASTEIAVLAHRGEEIVGGLFSYTNWDWLFIAQLWISAEVRAQGIGARLLAAAEEEARQRGCKHAHVDTFSFQALPFYQRLGYQIFGQLEDYPEGRTRYFLQKLDLHQNNRS